MSADGYRSSEAALSEVVNTLRGGAERLDGAVGAAPDAPDAGASSDAVGAALGALVRSAVTGAHTMDKTAGNVHASNGGYADVENTNTGELRRERQEGYGEKNMPLN